MELQPNPEKHKRHAIVVVAVGDDRGRLFEKLEARCFGT